MDTQQHSARNENLQILRFIAAALVLITHITFYIQERIQPGFGMWNGGVVGVPIFFVISGFVMQLTSPKFSRDGQGMRDFLKKRIIRIIPMYWLMTTFKITVAIVLPATVLHYRPDALTVLASYLLFPILNSEGDVRPLHGVGWTLLYEMFFYYVFALSLWLRQTPLVFCSIVIGGLWLIGLGVDEQAAFLRVCFDSLNLLFLCGMGLAWLIQRDMRLPKPVALAFLLISGVMLLNGELRNWLYARLHNFNIGAIMLVAAMLSLHTAVLPRLRAALASLGDSSYSLYMIHPILAPALCLGLAKLHVQSPLLIILVATTLGVGIAHGVHLLVEKPLNRLAARIMDSRFMPFFARG